MNIKEQFPKEYIIRLKRLLRTLKSESFLFTTSKQGHLLREEQFKKSFLKYCGKEFYPHIIRSFFATNEVKKFLSKKSKPTSVQAKNLCLHIAHKLGHKKFDKKNNIWKENYVVTLNNYVQPNLASKIKQLIKKRT